MTLKFGDIILVNFDPSVGREYKKVRPAVVIQESEISLSSPYVTVMPISSKIENLKGQEIFLSKNRRNKLMNDSVIKVQQISSFDQSRVIKNFGSLDNPTLRKVRGYLRRHFGL